MLVTPAASTAIPYSRAITAAGEYATAVGHEGACPREHSTDHAGVVVGHTKTSPACSPSNCASSPRPPPVPCSAQVTRRCCLAVGGVVTGVGKHRSMTHMTAAVTYRSPAGQEIGRPADPVHSWQVRDGRAPMPVPPSAPGPVLANRPRRQPTPRSSLSSKKTASSAPASPPRSASRRPTSTAVRRINPLGSPSTTRMLSSRDRVGVAGERQSCLEPFAPSSVARGESCPGFGESACRSASNVMSSDGRRDRARHGAAR